VTAGPGAVRPAAAGQDTSGLFPAGTAVTFLTVYDWSGPDGVVGASAHVHLACTVRLAAFPPSLKPPA
jgi:hypothetical protein